MRKTFYNIFFKGQATYFIKKGQVQITKIMMKTI